MNLTDEKILELAIGGGIYDCICDPYDKNGDGDQQSSIMHDLVRFARAILKEAGVEELGRDAERLDFIEANKMDRPLLFRKGQWSFARYSNYPVCAYTTLRKAIDAAKEEQ